MSSQKAILHLDRVISQSKFNFGDYIGKGFDLWKQQAGLFIGFGILYFILNAVVGIIPIVGTIISNLIISPCITAGTHFFSHRITKRKAEFGDFFAGFNKIGPIVLAVLITWIISFIFMAPFFGVVGVEIFKIYGDPMAFYDFYESFVGWHFLLLLPALFIYFLFAFTVPFVWFFDLAPMDAVKYSAKLLFKHWLIFVLFCIVVGFLALSGIILIGIGLLVTYSFIYPMMYAAFSDLTQLDAYENPDEEQTVRDMLVS